MKTRCPPLAGHGVVELCDDMGEHVVALYDGNIDAVGICSSGERMAGEHDQFPATARNSSAVMLQGVAPQQVLGDRRPSRVVRAGLGQRQLRRWQELPPAARRPREINPEGALEQCSLQRGSP